MIDVNNKSKMAGRVGKAGEFAVASKLLLLGVDVAFMAVGDGVDLVADNGCRIQVKSGHIRSTNSIIKAYGKPIYSMHFPKNRLVPIRNGETKLSPRKKFAEVCDVVVFWGIEENRFWIIPASICDVRQCVVLGPTNERAFVGDLKDMQEMVALGFSQAEIGQYYGVRQSSVGRRLAKADSETYGHSAVVKIRACENAWHHILDFGNQSEIESLTGKAESAPEITEGN